MRIYRYFVHVLDILLSLVSVHDSVCAFQPIRLTRERPVSFQILQDPQYNKSKICAAHNIEHKDTTPFEIANNDAGLRFQASLFRTTKPSPVPSEESGKKLADFFASEHNRNSLLVGTGNQKIVPFQEAPGSPSAGTLLNRWKREAALVGARAPVKNDQLVQLKLKTSFLVFTIFAVATLGTKLLLPPSPSDLRTDVTSKQAFPGYEFTLLDESFHAEGPSPLVWIFDQLTGAGKSSKAKKSDEHTIHGMFRFMAKPLGNGKYLAFSSKAVIDINIKFPAILLQLLPVDKGIIEKEGSKSLQKSLERDLPPGLENFYASYVQWLQQ